MLYASSPTDSSDLLGAITVKPPEDDVDSEEMDSVQLLAGIDDENVREAFTVSQYSTAGLLLLLQATV